MNYVSHRDYEEALRIIKKYKLQIENEISNYIRYNKFSSYKIVDVNMAEKLKSLMLHAVSYNEYDQTFPLDCDLYKSFTLRQASNIKRKNYHKVPNLGKKRLLQIEDVLEYYGFNLDF